MVKDSIVGFWQILRSMGLTLKYFFTKPVTVQYPKQPVKLYPRFRGRHELRRYEDGPYQGLERCIGCALCAAYCPTQCIYVRAGENSTPAEPESESGERPIGLLPRPTSGLTAPGAGSRSEQFISDSRRSPGERYAEIYEINLLRCMFCGYCEEACPTGAIVLRREFALADYSRQSLIYTQDRLLKPATPNAIILDDQK